MKIDFMTATVLVSQIALAAAAVWTVFTGLRKSNNSIEYTQYNESFMKILAPECPLGHISDLTPEDTQEDFVEKASKNKKFSASWYPAPRLLSNPAPPKEMRYGECFDNLKYLFSTIFKDSKVSKR